MTKSISILSYLSCSAKRKHFSGTRDPRSCARAFRVCARACFACRPWSKGFPCDDVRGPRGFSGVFAAFCDDNASICVYFAPGTRWTVGKLRCFSYVRGVISSLLTRSLAVCAWHCYTI